ncbi:MAG: S4 domain-containing protein, partial [Maricaulaceae bacterium]
AAGAGGGHPVRRPSRAEDPRRGDAEARPPAALETAAAQQGRVVSETLEQIRADIWLWRARFFKTRAEAGRALEAGKIRVDRNGVLRRLQKAGAGLAIGDALTFVRGGQPHTVRVLAFGVRRGPAREAQSLYVRLDTGQDARGREDGADVATG